MSLYAIWLAAGIVTIMILLLVIDRSMSKKKIAINNQDLPQVKPTNIVSMDEKKSLEKRFATLKKTA